MGVLRIEFSAADLGRTRLACAVDPLWELVLSRFRLHERSAQLAFRPWLRRVHRGLEQHGQRVRPAIRMLQAIAPTGPYFPDFLTPAEASKGLEAGLDAVRSVPRRRLTAEMRRLATLANPPGWLRPLADGDDELLAKLTDAMRIYHAEVLAPSQDLISGSVANDLAYRTKLLVSEGVDGLLHSLGPQLRWHYPVLEVDYPVDHHLRLAGRGLQLVPSYFCFRAPVSLADPELPPVLLYPIESDLRWHAADHEVAPQRSLGALVGDRRAAILSAIDPYHVGQGVTTTQLAGRLNASPASVSRHTTVLRDAGLITTRRHANAVMHTLTRLGSALIAG